MNLTATLTPVQLAEFLLAVAPVRPVFIWGPPGIGKSALVQQFASAVGLPCVSLLGSQLAPEDLIGVPQILDGTSRFCPPRMIARDDPYCLFLDELNACSPEVQKAFYSLIHERRIAEYHLPDGSIVVGAGNRSQDSAIVKPMSSALLNRMVHVQLKVSHREWLDWAATNALHPLVLDYIRTRPDHLWSQPPKTEEPFSTPRSWHMLSDALYGCGFAAKDLNDLDDLDLTSGPSPAASAAPTFTPDAAWLDADPEAGPAVPDTAATKAPASAPLVPPAPSATADLLDVLASGCLTPSHAQQFKAFVKQLRSKFRLAAILKGQVGWPRELEDRDVLYFLAQSFRAQLVKELPASANHLAGRHRALAHRAKALLRDLAAISLEIAQLVVAKDESGQGLPAWFMVEIVRDLPRLVERRDAA